MRPNNFEGRSTIMRARLGFDPSHGVARAEATTEDETRSCRDRRRESRHATRDESVPGVSTMPAGNRPVGLELEFDTC